MLKKDSLIYDQLKALHFATEIVRFLDRAEGEGVIDEETRRILWQRSVVDYKQATSLNRQELERLIRSAFNDNPSVHSDPEKALFSLICDDM